MREVSEDALKAIIKEFVVERWGAFLTHCEESGVQPEFVYSEKLDELVDEALYNEEGRVWML